MVCQCSHRWSTHALFAFRDPCLACIVGAGGAPADQAASDVVWSWVLCHLRRNPSRSAPSLFCSCASTHAHKRADASRANTHRGHAYTRTRPATRSSSHPPTTHSPRTTTHLRSHHVRHHAAHKCIAHTHTPARHMLHTRPPKSNFHIRHLHTHMPLPYFTPTTSHPFTHHHRCHYGLPHPQSPPPLYCIKIPTHRHHCPRHHSTTANPPYHSAFLALPGSTTAGAAGRTSHYRHPLPPPLTPFPPTTLPCHTATICSILLTAF